MAVVRKMTIVPTSWRKTRSLARRDRRRQQGSSSVWRATGARAPLQKVFPYFRRRPIFPLSLIVPKEPTILCGRYDNLIAREAYRALFKAERLPAVEFSAALQHRADRPDPDRARRSARRHARADMARWGLIPFWMKEKPKVPHINARAETVAQDCRSSARRSPSGGRLIPATGFFEWQKRADGKQPYRFVRKDLEPFAFAGLWEFARARRRGDPLGGDHRRRAQSARRRRSTTACRSSSCRTIMTAGSTPTRRSRSARDAEAV